MKRLVVTAAVISLLVSAMAKGEIREIRQTIFGMD